MGGTHYGHTDGFMWVAALHSIVKGGPTLLSSVLPYTNTETQT